MFQLLYTSTASRPLSEPDLQKILARSRTLNAINAITGALLFHRGAFLQVLEGTEAQVETVFSRIERDPRHRNVHVLSRLIVGQREFSDWSMRFLDTGLWPIDAGLIGYNSLPEFAAADSSMKRYLRLFHVGISRNQLLA